MPERVVSEAGPRRSGAGRWRVWLRAAHRDIGYLVVGFTVIYAVSGIAVNHVEDWNPSYTESRRSVVIDAKIPEDEQGAITVIMRELAIDGEVTHYARIADQLQLEVGQQLVTVDLDSGVADYDLREPRLLLAVINWLHLARGKRAWVWFADAYALLLLVLAGSGLFMLRGRKGILGRGGVLVLLGVAVPVLYVHFSGGP